MSLESRNQELGVDELMSFSFLPVDGFGIDEENKILVSQTPRLTDSKIY